MEPITLREIMDGSPRFDLTREEMERSFLANMAVEYEDIVNSREHQIAMAGGLSATQKRFRQARRAADRREARGE